mmetsp:Transcript_37569/g.98393  ORF Transcript_37569/g.98393 Transcript_37569/m.98393 type:complete len:290 (+) Transcript_37569:225-1094(+)
MAEQIQKLTLDNSILTGQVRSATDAKKALETQVDELRTEIEGLKQAAANGDTSELEAQVARLRETVAEKAKGNTEKEAEVQQYMQLYHAAVERNSRFRLKMDQMQQYLQAVYTRTTKSIEHCCADDADDQAVSTPKPMEAIKQVPMLASVARAFAGSRQQSIPFVQQPQGFRAVVASAVQSARAHHEMVQYAPMAPRAVVVDNPQLQQANAFPPGESVDRRVNVLQSMSRDEATRRVLRSSRTHNFDAMPAAAYSSVPTNMLRSASPPAKSRMPDSPRRAQASATMYTA